MGFLSRLFGRRLPRCRHYEERDPVLVMQDFLADPGLGEVYLAASEDFFDVDDETILQTTYAAYEAEFGKIAARLKQGHGQPSFEGTWEDPGYPDFAVGERIVAWSHPEPFYLRLHHEDAELPILIALSRPDAGNAEDEEDPDDEWEEWEEDDEEEEEQERSS